MGRECCCVQSRSQGWAHSVQPCIVPRAVNGVQACEGHWFQLLFWCLGRIGGQQRDRVSLVSLKIQLYPGLSDFPPSLLLSSLPSPIFLLSSSLLPSLYPVTKLLFPASPVLGIEDTRRDSTVASVRTHSLSGKRNIRTASFCADSTTHRGQGSAGGRVF